MISPHFLAKNGGKPAFLTEMAALTGHKSSWHMKVRKGGLPPLLAYRPHFNLFLKTSK